MIGRKQQWIGELGLAQAGEGGAFRWMVVGGDRRKEMERWRRMEGGDGDGHI